MADGWGRDVGLEVRFWKDLDDLRGVILAGKGDIWVGHLDGFAQTARRGAPIALIAVTAWAEKFQFLTLDAEATSPAILSERMAALNETLAVTPQGSPALAILDAARTEGGPAFRALPMPPQQIGLGLARGAIRHLMVPDPLAAALIAERPDLIADLTARMSAWSERNRDDAAAIVAALPRTTRDEIGEGPLTASLRFDPLRTRDAASAREDIVRALAILDGPYPLAPGFLPPEILARLFELAAGGSLLSEGARTAARGVGGVILANLLGVGLGLAAGLLPPLSRLLRPLHTALNACPPVVWISLAMVWMGSGGGVPVFAVAAATLPPVFLSTVEGIGAIPPRLTEMSRLFRVPATRRLRGLILPGVFPFWRAAFAHTASAAWKVAAVAEYLGSADGVGARIYWSYRRLEMADLYAWTLAIVAFGVAIDVGLIARLRRANRRRPFAS